MVSSKTLYALKHKETGEFFLGRIKGETFYTTNPSIAMLCDSRTEAAIRIVQLGAAFILEPALV